MVLAGAIEDWIKKRQLARLEEARAEAYANILTNLPSEMRESILTQLPPEIRREIEGILRDMNGGGADA